QAEWLMAQLAWQGMGGNDSAKRLDHYRRHGVGPEQIEGFRGRGNHYRQLVPTVVPQFRTVREGDTVTIGGRRWHAFPVLRPGPARPLRAGGERPDPGDPGPAEDPHERDRRARSTARQPAPAVPRFPPALSPPAGRHACAAVARSAVPRPASPPRLLAAAPRRAVGRNGERHRGAAHRLRARARTLPASARPPPTR